MGPSIVYKSTAADDRYLTELTVEPDGTGRLSVGSNRDRRSAAIGHFQGPLTQPQIQKLSSGTGAAFAGAPSQSSLVPDESYREIRVAAPGAAPVTKIIGEQGPAPAPVASLELVLLEIIAHLQQFPVAALAMRVSLPATARAGSPMDMEVALANPGRTLLRLPGPRSWGQGGVACDLMVLRADVPTSALGPKDQRFVQVGGANFVASDPPAAANEILLRSSENNRLRFRVAADWPPGRYALELSLGVTAFGSDAKPVFRGGLVSERQSVEVARRQ